MEIWQIALETIMGAVTVLLGIYTSFTARQKGLIFSNLYIWEDKKEQEKADKKAEYRLVTVIFGGLTMFFLMDTIRILMSSILPLVIGFCFIGFDITYAVVRAVKNKNRRCNFYSHSHNFKKSCNFPLDRTIPSDQLIY